MSHEDAVAAALGKIIRDTAEDKGLTITDLAKLSGIHRVTMQRYVAGDRTMQLSTLAAVASVLRADAGTMLNQAIQAASRNTEQD